MNWETDSRNEWLAKGLKEEDLPKECISTSLLNVSLAYEKILLPESYASGGEEATRQHFSKTQAKDTFCSVDLDGVLTNPKWKILFEEESSSVSVDVVLKWMMYVGRFARNGRVCWYVEWRGWMDIQYHKSRCEEEVVLHLELVNSEKCSKIISQSLKIIYL